MADLLSAGIKPNNIMNIVGCSKALVSKVKKKVSKGESLQEKPRSGRPKKMDVGPAVAATIEADPTTSVNQMARKLNVSVSTVKKRVDELGFKSYVRRHRQLLSEASQRSRMERGQKLITWLKHHPSTVQIFSDKKMWTVDQARNAQNDRYLATSPSEVPPSTRASTRLVP